MSKPEPLYPTRAELMDMSLNDYPQLTGYLSIQENWVQSHWDWGNQFLRYIGRNKSEHTYMRFRNEVERFLLWAFLEKGAPNEDRFFQQRWRHHIKQEMATI